MSADPPGHKSTATDAHAEAGAVAPRDGVLTKVEATRRLWVPCSTRPTGQVVRTRPPGTRVRRGDRLIESVQQSDHAVLAPADGTVGTVETVRLLDGRQVTAVALDPDPPAGAESPSMTDGAATDLARPAPASPPRTQPSADLFGEVHGAERGTWIDELRHAGIWADRWGSPDLTAQLHQTLRRPVDTIVCNVLDPDRAMPLQSVVADSYAAELAAGVALLAKLAGAERAWVVVDRHSPEGFQEELRVAVEKAGARLVPLQNDYPQAHPTLLLHALLGRRLPPDHLPTDAGALVADAATAVAVGRFERTREPMLSVPLAVYDAAAERTYFSWVPVGMSLRDVLDHHKIGADGATIRGGAPPRDLRLAAGAVAGGAELTAYVTDAETDVNPDPCIRSGWCVEACPVRIHPAGLLEAAHQTDPELAESYGLAACIECGVCSYVCPSRLPLLEGIRTLRRRGHVS
jgi:electron transport complex protein RnfC